MAKTAKDGEQEAGTRRPKRKPNPSAALLNNSEQVTLPSQQQAIKDFRLAEATRRAAEIEAPVEAEALATPSPISSRKSLPIDSSGSASPILLGSRNRKRAYVSDDQDEPESESEIEIAEREDARTNPKPKGKHNLLVSEYTYLYISAKKTRTTLRTAVAPEQEAVDESGILADIDVQSIAETTSTREGRTADIEEFFSTPYDHQGAGGAIKKHRKCKICP